MFSIILERVILYATISSKYSTIKRSRNGYSILFMSVQNVAYVFVRPKGITKNSKDPYLFTYVVFGSSP